MVRAKAFSVLGLMWLVFVACGVDSREDHGRALGRESAIRALESLTQIASRAGDTSVLSRVASRAAAFQRAADDASIDAETRGRIVSEGWRSAKEKRFSDVGARLPDEASGELTVGTSRFFGRHVRVTLEGASESAAVVHGGRVVYADALPFTDRVLVSDATAVEEFVVLRDARAPQRFSWRIALPENIADVRREEHSGGGYMFEDAAGKPILHMPALLAWDANGAEIAVTSAWSEESQTLSADLAAKTVHGAPITYPVALDPTFETSVWIPSTTRDITARFRHAMAYDSAHDRVVLFGGNDVTGQRKNDTWLYNGGTNTWTPGSAAPAALTGRLGHAMAYDAAHDRVILFGGRDAAGEWKNDTWLYNGGTNTWTQGPAAPTGLAGRFFHAMAYDSAHDRVVLFGGVEEGARTNDTWLYNGGTNTWTQGPAAPAGLTGRFGHAMAYDSAHDRVVLFGGQDTTFGIQNDTWLYNGATSTWTQGPASPTGLTGRYWHAMAYDAAHDRVVLFGGGDAAGERKNDTWLYNGGANTWTQGPASPTGSTGRLGHAMAYDPAQDRVVLFGGSDGASQVKKDTWLYNGATSTWTGSVTLAGLTARSEHAMAYDAAHDRVLLFGGFDDATGINNETWLYDGATNTWTQAPAAPAGLTGRFGHAMAYDVAHDRVLLFGGIDTNLRKNDTWIYNGTTRTWTERGEAPTGPTARSHHAMAYDVAHDRVVLFGGYDGTRYSNDTWLYSGTTDTWTQGRAVPSGLTARSNHAMAYDAAHDRVVLFGGFDALFQRRNDTWLYNGATDTWTQGGAAPTGLTARDNHAMVYDAAHDRVVLFGGGDIMGLRKNDTWLYNGATNTWAPTASKNVPVRSVRSLAFDTSRGQTVLFGGSTPTGSSLGDMWFHIILGGGCATNFDCRGAQAYCTDGVCCDVEACGSCQSCNGGSLGRCSPVLNEDDPDTCPASDGKACSRRGDCKAALGVANTRADDCASGFLTDGVCCEAAACGPCLTCDIVKKERAEFPGRCSAARAGTDPKSECTEAAAATCKDNGACDGSGACQLYKNGTACGESACTDNRATGQLCSGTGTCGKDQGVECAPYACRNNIGCAPRCDSAADCAPLHRCEAGGCVPDQGVVCDGNTLVSSTGERAACGLYRCVGGACVQRCKSRLECTGNADCDNGTCIAFAARAVDEFGGCAMSPAFPSPANGALGLVLVVLRPARKRLGILRALIRAKRRARYRLRG